MKRSFLTVGLLAIAGAFLFCSCSVGTPKETEGLEYMAYDGSYVVAGYSGSDVHVVVPDTHEGKEVTGIAEGCFANTDLQSIKLGKNIRAIDDGAFYNASMLEEVVIPASVEQLGSGYTSAGAFESCTSLEKVTFEKGSRLTAVGYAVFADCKALKSIEIPQGVLEIDGSAFRGCSSLERVLLPEGLEFIGDGAFAGATGIKTLSIPASVSYCGTRVFRDFGEDQIIKINGDTSGWWQNSKKNYGYGIVAEDGWQVGCNAQIEYK